MPTKSERLPSQMSKVPFFRSSGEEFIEKACKQAVAMSDRPVHPTVPKYPFLHGRLSQQVYRME
jgi:hypothetical protein